MTNRIGDRPRFPLPNQRFDKGDAENISKFYEDTISRFVGSLYGQAWGCVSNPQFYVESELILGVSRPFLKLRKCILLQSTPDSGVLNATNEDYGPWNARLVHYDPTREGQSIPILDLTTMNSQRRWILFRRAETPTDTSNKVYWDTSSSSEVVGATELVMSELVQFTTTTTYTESLRSQGWVRMAYIDSWSTPSTPVVIPIHWIDSQYYNDSTPPTQSVALGSALAYPGFTATYGKKGFSPETEMPELAKLMHWVTGKLGQHYSTTAVRQVTSADQATYNAKPGAFVVDYGDTAGGWLSTPPRGLLELNNDLAVAESDIVDLNAVDVSLVQSISAFMQKYMKTQRLLHTLYVTPVSGPGGSVAYDVVVGSSVSEPDSFSPTFGVYPGPGIGVTPTPGLQYRVRTGNTEGAQFKMFLDLVCPQSEPNRYVITAVNIVPQDPPLIPLSTDRDNSTTIRQRYVAQVPPATQLEIEFSIQDPLFQVGGSVPANEVRDLVFPFTVYIYGRNL